jgi:hypothetical protein
MDTLGGSPKDAAIKAFRECLSKYKHQFNNLTTTDGNKQDTADANEVIRLIDDLYSRLLPILNEFLEGKEPKRPTQDTPLEYSFFTDGKLEYLYTDRAAANDFKYYLENDLKKFPFTYDVGIIESYNGIPVKPPIIVSNEDVKV